MQTTKIFSYVDESGTQQSVLSDLNSKSGKKLLEKVNNALENGRTGKLQNISTESVTPKGYLIPEKGVFTSYDGGKTYVIKKVYLKRCPVEQCRLVIPLHIK